MYTNLTNMEDDTIIQWRVSTNWSM